LRQLLLERVSDDDLAAIVDRLVELARDGDLAAIKLVLSYAVGKPTAAVDPDRIDIEEFDIFMHEAKSREQFMTPINGMPAGLAGDLIRAVLPELTAKQCATGAAMSADFERKVQEQAQAAQAAPVQPPSAAPAPAAAPAAPAPAGERPAPRQRQSTPARQ